MKQKIEELVEDRKLREASELLAKAMQEGIPADERHAYSALARRADNSRLAAKILWPNIYELKTNKYEDILEYAHALRKMNLPLQALRLLKKLKETDDVHKARAFCHIIRWDYEHAANELEKFSHLENLPKDQLDSYRLNLAACLIDTSRFDEAQDVLNTLEESGVHERSSTFSLNCEELMGQLMFFRGEMEEAVDHFEQLSKKNKKVDDKSVLFVKKWLFIAKSVASQEVSDSEFKKISSLTRKLQHWETLRDLDFHVGSIRKDFVVIDRFYFGSSSPLCKKRVSEIETWYKPAKFFIWHDRREPNYDKTIDSYHLDSKHIAIGLTLHRLFLILCSDFYSPWSAGRIFDSLFEDEEYNPTTSDKRIQKLVSDLRGVFDKEQWSISLDTTSAGYRLRPLGKTAIRVYPEMLFLNSEDFFAAALRSRFEDTEFSASDVQEQLSISSDQWNRVANKLNAKDQIEPHGEGRGRKYTMKR